MNLSKFNDQLKVLEWEILSKAVLKYNVEIICKFCAILLFMEWSVPLPTIRIREKNVPMDDATINNDLGISKPLNFTFKSNI